MKISGIYQIQSIVKPERVYIGSSCDVERRWKNHKNDLKKEKHHSHKLQWHYNKYTKDDLIFIIIEPCLPEFLIVREKYYVKELKPYFNECPVAGSPLGLKRSKETCELLRVTHLGISKGEKSPSFGKKNTPEHILKSSVTFFKKGDAPWNKGKKTGLHPTNTFQKGIVPWNKGKTGIHTEEQLEHNRATHRDKHPSEETKAKMRKAHVLRNNKVA